MCHNQGPFKVLFSSLLTTQIMTLTCWRSGSTSVALVTLIGTLTCAEKEPFGVEDVIFTICCELINSFETMIQRLQTWEIG